ncbi:hypothetical protein H920_00495 [Fukomys damarensis]|uniref:Uncharacterized protein n=1 Tax=Fukomys damarensis TaxID=885580 RepID=A0A091E668_FUKDA|nr:hypothetical protein H920_00495 [Fukomys damarensis]
MMAVTGITTLVQPNCIKKTQGWLHPVRLPAPPLPRATVGAEWQFCDPISAEQDEEGGFCISSLNNVFHHSFSKQRAEEFLKENIKHESNASTLTASATEEMLLLCAPLRGSALGPDPAREVTTHFSPAPAVPQPAPASQA